MSDDNEQPDSVWGDLSDPTKAGFGEGKPKRAKKVKAPRLKKGAPAPVVAAETNFDEEGPSVVPVDSETYTPPKGRVNSPKFLTPPKDKPKREVKLPRWLTPAVGIASAACLAVGIGGGFALASATTPAPEAIEYQSTVDPNSGWLYVENLIEGMPGSAKTILDRGFAETTVEKDLDPIADAIAAQLATVVGYEVPKDGEATYPEILTNEDKEVLTVQATTAPRSTLVERRDDLKQGIIDTMNSYVATAGGWTEPTAIDQDGSFFLTSYRVDDPLESWTVILVPHSAEEGDITDLVSVSVTSAWHVPEGKETLLEEYVVQKAKAQLKAE